MTDMCKQLSDAEVTIIQGALADEEQLRLYVHPRCGMRGQFAAFSKLPVETRTAINDAITECSFYNIAEPNPNACIYVYRQKNGIHYTANYVILRDAQGGWWGVTKNTHELGKYLLLQANIRQRRAWSLLTEIRKFTWMRFFLSIVAFVLGIVGMWIEGRHSFGNMLGPAIFTVIGAFLLADILIFSYFRHSAAFRKLSIAMIDADAHKGVKTPDSTATKKEVAGDRDGPVSVI